MSYHNSVDLRYIESEAIDPLEFKEELQQMLKVEKLHADVGADIVSLFTEREATFNLYGGCWALEPLLKWVSNRKPTIAFGVRGRGEDLRDIWVREFVGGNVTYKEGPFNEI